GGQLDTDCAPFGRGGGRLSRLPVHDVVATGFGTVDHRVYTSSHEPVPDDRLERHLDLDGDATSPLTLLEGTLEFEEVLVLPRRFVRGPGQFVEQGDPLSEAFLQPTVEGGPTSGVRCGWSRQWATDLSGQRRRITGQPHHGRHRQVIGQFDLDRTFLGPGFLVAAMGEQQFGGSLPTLEASTQPGGRRTPPPRALARQEPGACLCHPSGAVQAPRATIGRITGRWFPFLLRRPGHGTFLVLAGVLRVRVGAGFPLYDRARAVIAR